MSTGFNLDGMAAKRARFARIPSTTFLGRIARLPLRLIPGRSVLPILTGPLKGRRWIVASGVHGHWLGTYEMELQRAITGNVTAGGVFYDIGAHAGYYSLLASRLVGSAGRVVAFEPDTRNLAYLTRHLRVNGVRNVTVVAAAVADRAGTARFAAERSGFGGTLSTDGSRSVRTVTLDGVVRAGEVPAPDYLKIDVEGAELAVLRGGTEVIRASRPIIFLAIHTPEMARLCGKMLMDLGYRFSAIMPDGWLCRAVPA
jgi:FkbM family methyltransferase